jgi:hypothetical protein
VERARALFNGWLGDVGGPVPHVSETAVPETTARIW